MLYYENYDLAPLEGEIWKSIEGYGGQYYVSNLGRVYSAEKTFTSGRKYTQVITIHAKVLHQVKDVNGYLNVYLLKGTKQGKNNKVHRLVLGAFVENTENHPSVNHINAIKHDNRLENLEWISHSGNMLHAMAMGRVNFRSGKTHYQSKTVYQYSLKGDLLNVYDSIGMAQKATGYNASQIGKTCNGIFSFYKDFVWSYVEKDLEYFNREFKKREGKKKEVIQYDLDGNEICRHFNTKEASIKLNCAQSNIIHAAKGKFNTAYGFKWKYADDIK